MTGTAEGARTTGLKKLPPPGSNGVPQPVPPRWSLPVLVSAVDGENQAPGGFGLAYGAMNATDVRTELGSRFDAPTVLCGKPLVLYGRLAWGHDFVSNPALSAAAHALPGSNFTVLGAPLPRD